MVTIGDMSATDLVISGIVPILHPKTVQVQNAILHTRTRKGYVKV